jgi:predicted RNA binding protein YcfA (HicA-like mRNA interferase family)
MKFRFGSLTVIVPAAKREIPYGTFISILRQSGLSKHDFE